MDSAGVPCPMVHAGPCPLAPGGRIGRGAPTATISCMRRQGAVRGQPRGVATAGDQCNAAARRTALAARTSRSECARRRDSRCALGAGVNYTPSYAPGDMAAHCWWRLPRPPRRRHFLQVVLIFKIQEFALAQAAHF